MTIRNEVTEGLKNLSKTLNSEPVKKQTDQIKVNHEKAQAALYKTLDQVKSGFKQATDTLKDVSTNVDGSVPNQVIEQLNIALLDQTAASELVNEVGSDQTDLETIVGKTALAADGFLDVVVSAPFPEALAATLKDVTTLTSAQITELVRGNVEDATGEDPAVEDVNVDEIKNIVGNLYPDTQSVNSQRSKLLSEISSNTQKLLREAQVGFNTLIENVVEQTRAPAERALKAATNNQISNADLQTVFQQISREDYTNAAKVLQKYSTQTLAELESIVITINNKASNQFSDTTTPRNLRVQRTDTFKNLWREDLTEQLDQIFVPIVGREVTAEVLNLSREVTEVIVVFMEEPGATIKAYHQRYAERYNIGFNPHFYLGYDAVVYRGRPLEIEAKSNTNTITNEHYKRSIIIGVNIDDKSTTHKFAPSQQDKLKSLIESILEAKPGLQVFGAKDVGWTYNESTDALDIPRFVKQKLNKTNIVDYDPELNPPLTGDELATYDID